MHQVRVSFFVFFFLSKALIDRFLLLATNEQKKGLNDQKWTNLELRIWILYFRHYQQNFPNTTPEHPGSRWTKENRGVQLIIPLKFHYGAMLAQHNQLHPDDRGINLSKDPPDQYQCLKHRKKELPSMAVAGKGNNHISNRMRPLLAALCLSNFLGTRPASIEASSFFLSFKHWYWFRWSFETLIHHRDN